MPRPNAKIWDFDPNKSDSADSDFEEGPSSPPARRSKHSSSKRKSQSTAHRTPQRKRARKNYGSDSDIVEDDDEISEEEFTESSEEEVIERHPVTGRAVRGARKKEVVYEESDAEDTPAEFIEGTEESGNEEAGGRDELDESPKKTRSGAKGLRQGLLKPSKVVRLRFRNWQGLSSSARGSPVPEYSSTATKKEEGTSKAAEMREETGRATRARSLRSQSRAVSNPPTAQPTSRTQTRRSSRLSREPEPMVALSSSGRHAVPASSDPEDEDVHEEVGRPRRAVGGKAPRGQPSRKMPSVVMEQSQEGTQPADEANGDDVREGEIDSEADASGLQNPPHDVVDSVEMHADESGEVAMEDRPPELAKATLAQQMATDGTVAQVEVPEVEVEEVEEAAHAESEESDGPVGGPRRTLRTRQKPASRSPAKRKRADDESSEFAPEGSEKGDEENMSEEEEDDGRRRGKRLRRGGSSSQSQNGGGRGRSRRAGRSRAQSSDDEVDSEEVDPDELLEEAADLKRATRESKRTRQAQNVDSQGIAFEDGRRRRTAGRVDYSIKPLNELFQEDAQAAESGADLAGGASQGGRRKKKRKEQRLHSVSGIFGGWGLGQGLLKSELDDIALMGADPASSDEEDDELPPQLKTPRAQDAAGGPADFGKITKEKKVGADTDPLGVDETVKFDAVGGLDDHINALKEMVLHPLMYPEVIGKFGVQPPRGVLFHGPPGTGKTLLARALSNSIESEGKKVTFFMRKGADALSKWVGEAERQLRLLFEEAQKCQPSIIFFDEIDGLAPTRSSKTEQIHASIVATLLALMDGMDNRGQVVVIGATNRPDNVDPALRRPGRFDREFYFPLPSKAARLSIIDINTKGWQPALTPELKDQLAELTVGYGGADLRALCTEAALNAIQGTYPQIYKSNRKLLVDPGKIKVLAKDFMISVNKITPSSARSHISKIEPLAKSVEPLLREPLENIGKIIDEILPRRKKLTALEEAEFDDRDDVGGFERDMLLREIDRAKIFRPRLLVHGLRGMGQQELASALLHKLEGLFVQSFDMATLMEDSSRSPEAAVVQLFKEVRRQKPSVVFLPDCDIWYQTVGDNVLKIFMQQLRSIPANDPVLLLGIMGSETIEAEPDKAMLRDLFGFSKKSLYKLERPGRQARYEYWSSLMTLIKKRPTEFPDPENRKKRTLPILPEVKPSALEVRAQDKQKRKAQYREERNALNLLKMSIGVVFEQIKKKYGILRQAQIPQANYKYLFDDADAGTLTSDLTEEQRRELGEQRPFVLDVDKHGRGVLREVVTGKFYYNMDIEDIEERLANGYYRRWKDFLADVRTIMHDAMTVDAGAMGDPDKQDDRRRKTQELVNNVEVDLESFRREKPDLERQLALMYQRVLEEYKERKAKGLPIHGLDGGDVQAQGRGHPVGTTTNRAPILGPAPAPTPAGAMAPPPFTPLRNPSAHTNGTGSGGHLTNGTSKGDAEGDVIMEDAGAAPAQQYSKQYSQRNALEKMAPGSQIDDYRNSGSTTTEGRNHSNRTSGGGAHPPAPATAPPQLGGFRQSAWSAHTPSGYPQGYHPPQSDPGVQHNQGGEKDPNSNGTDSRYYPQLESAMHDLEGLNDSVSQNFPDTQPGTEHSNSLGTRSGGSSTQPAPGATAPTIANLLTNPAPSSGPAGAMVKRHVPAPMFVLPSPVAEETEKHPPFIPREEEIHQLHDMLADQTSGFSVEQLVQTMAELVGEVVRKSREWDKLVVVRGLQAVFEEARRDIESCQVVMEGSYGEVV